MMTNDEKRIFYKDLVGRLGTNTIVRLNNPKSKYEYLTIDFLSKNDIDDIILVLRPFESMTNSEREEYLKKCNELPFDNIFTPTPRLYDYLDEIHINYRGLTKNIELVKSEYPTI